MEREIAGAVSREAEYLFDWPYDLSITIEGMERPIDRQELEQSEDSAESRSSHGRAEHHAQRAQEQARYGSSRSRSGKENRIRELEPFAIVTQEVSDRGLRRASRGSRSDANDVRARSRAPR